MPKRKLVKPSEETLEAIKQARKHGTPLTEEEARKIQSSAYRLPTPAPPLGAITDEGKHGEPRYWAPDQPKGPGLLEPPLSRELQEMERDYLTEQAKRDRRAPVEAATQARIARSRRKAIEQAWWEHGLNTRHAAKQIAQALKLSAAYVRKVRAEMRLTEGKE